MNPMKWSKMINQQQPRYIVYPSKYFSVISGMANKEVLVVWKYIQQNLIILFLDHFATLHIAKVFWCTKVYFFFSFFIHLSSNPLYNSKICQNKLDFYKHSNHKGPFYMFLWVVFMDLYDCELLCLYWSVWLYREQFYTVPCWIIKSLAWLSFIKLSSKTNCIILVSTLIAVWNIRTKH